MIIKANYIKDNFLIEVVINQFDNNFDLKSTIQSKKINIENKKWIINNPTITKENISQKNDVNLELSTNFDKEKISGLFSNISTLNLIELFDLKKDYEKLGYSSDEIKIHIFKLFLSPYLFALMTVLSSIIMINIKKNKTMFFHIILGIFTSVIIYYFNYVFLSLGNTGKIPPSVSVFLPILFITIISMIGLVRVNEK